MSWEPLGVVFRPDGDTAWMRSHASNPTAHPLGGNTYRVFFASRDAMNRSHVAWFDLDLKAPHDPVGVARAPSLAPGPLGHFDDHGVYASSVLPVDGKLLLYYTGWNRGPSPLFYTSIGLATSTDDGETFQRTSPAPILARHAIDPWMVSQPTVRRTGDGWHMWYISGLGWEHHADAIDSRYLIRHATSSDGIEWHRSRAPSIDLGPSDQKISRASILVGDDGHHAWFGYTNKNTGLHYRLGYAHSPDGLRFERHDGDVHLPRTPGFDDQAQTYPHVFVHDGARYMLYNGNEHGRAGIALAREVR